MPNRKQLSHEAYSIYDSYLLAGYPIVAAQIAQENSLGPMHVQIAALTFVATTKQKIDTLRSQLNDRQTSREECNVIVDRLDSLIQILNMHVQVFGLQIRAVHEYVGSTATRDMLKNPRRQLSITNNLPN